MKTISELFHKLGILPNQKGYFCLLTGVEYLQTHPEAKIPVVKELYPYIAGKLGCTADSVERNIRTVRDRCWGNPAARELLRVELGVYEKPGNAAFLAALAVGTETAIEEV